MGVEAERPRGDRPRRERAAGRSLYGRRDDLIVGVALAAAAGLLSFQASALLHPVVYQFGAIDAWFHGDVPRVSEDLIGSNGNRTRSHVHPLFTLLASPPARLVRAVLDLRPHTVVRGFTAVVAALWIAALFALLRRIGCRPIDAALFTVLAGTSAAAMAWFVVPETWGLGSVTIVAALGLVAAERRPPSPLRCAVVSALTLSVTVTNWMAGLIVTAVLHRWRQMVQITANALCIVVVLWAVEKYFFPNVQFFFVPPGEQGDILLPESGGPPAVLRSFLFHSMVMPEVRPARRVFIPDWPPLSVQEAPVGSGSRVGPAAAVLWGALLAIGAWALYAESRLVRFRRALLLVLFGQMALHCVYGDETFLYALHFTPLLVVLAAWGTRTRARPVVLAGAALLIGLAGFNNAVQFARALDSLVTRGSPRHQVRAQQQRRPRDPWPRGSGHVVLAVPGSGDADKAYHEPGGSFSPSAGSFGVSIWMWDAYRGHLKSTSETLPAGAIRQRFAWGDGALLPSVVTETDDYRAAWSSQGLGRWRLSLGWPKHLRPALVVRSPGPAGGPVRSLHWDGKRVLVNQRWKITFQPTAALIDFGQEGAPGWMAQRLGSAEWNGNGWGYARIEPVGAGPWTFQLEDLEAKPVPGLEVASSRAAVDVDLPDPCFRACLDAQVSHLLMSLVGAETRPAEPLSFPAAWLRDGAAVVAALAAAGQVDVARELAVPFAEHDFFGGFGSEADGPGLALWALEAVAARAPDPAFDRSLWPHVRRKAQWILTMRGATQPVHWPPSGPTLPAHAQHNLTLVADPGFDGLINGRAELRNPLLYVNAVSYRGLLAAAALAERLGEGADAETWRAAAGRLQQAWGTAFAAKPDDDPATYGAALWPSGIVAPDATRFAERLRARWRRTRDEHGNLRAVPVRTHPELAEAHQWVLLGRVEPVWATLRWFWAHQDAPGLFTWWRQRGVESDFGRWERIRGWLNPQRVAPDYRTAAEMVLLQLDMLAHVADAPPEPVLVLGAGVPPDWLAHPIRIGGLRTALGQVDWSWDGARVRATVRGARVSVRLGPAFPPRTPVDVAYTPLGR
jgi:hypothetical protein